MCSKAPLGSCDSLLGLSGPWQFWELLIRYFVACPSTGIFLLTSMGLRLWGGRGGRRGKVHFVTVYQGYIPSPWLISVDGGPKHPAEAVFVRFHHHTVILSFPPIRTVLLGREWPCVVPKEGVMGHAHGILFGILLHRTFVSTHPFAHS